MGAPRRRGEASVRRIVDDFVDLIVADPDVDYSRAGRFQLDGERMAYTKRRSFEIISLATGGPYAYVGRGLKEIHQAMGISDGEFDAAARDFRRALGKNDVSADVVALALSLIEATRPDIVTAPSA